MMKASCLGNWARNRCCWIPKFWPWTKWFKLINKLRDKSIRWIKTKIPWTRRFLHGLRNVKKVHHIHLCQRIALILVGKIQIFHRTDLPLLFYMMLHFWCIYKKFIVHLSLKRFHLRSILWLKQKIILLDVKSRKVLFFHFQFS